MGGIPVGYKLHIVWSSWFQDHHRQIQLVAWRRIWTWDLRITNPMPLPLGHSRLQPYEIRSDLRSSKQNTPHTLLSFDTSDTYCFAILSFACCEHTSSLLYDIQHIYQEMPCNACSFLYKILYQTAVVWSLRSTCHALVLLCSSPPLCFPFRRIISYQWRSLSNIIEISLAAVWQDMETFWKKNYKTKVITL